MKARSVGLGAMSLLLLSMAACSPDDAGAPASSDVPPVTAGPPHAGAGGSATAGASGGSGISGAAGSVNMAGAGGVSGAGGNPTDDMQAADDVTFAVDVQLASDLDADAPGTIGIVTWSTTAASVSSAFVEFGLDTSYGMRAPVDLNEPDYRTLLLGMKPSRSYHLRVVAAGGSTEYASDDHVIETGPATNAVRIGDFNVVDEGARERGFIVTSYWQGEGASVAFILDSDGEIVWWYDFGVDGIARARMSADGKNMWMIGPDNNGSPLMRVSMDTLEEQTYGATIGSHDITPVSGETMAYLDYSENDCDSIFEIDPSGATEEVFESDDVLQSGGGGPGAGGCHANALRYSQAEDVYTFSDVAQDILIVNRAGGVEWRVSEILSGGIAAYGSRNHGHHLLGDSIVIFANNGAGNMVSTIVEYTLAGQEIWRYNSGDFSANLGDVQRLPGGNTLVTYSNASIVHEVDPERNLVMEFDGAGSRIGYALWQETLYGPPADIGD